MTARAVEAVVVSSEMVTLIGTGALAGVALPGEAAALAFQMGGDGAASVRVLADAGEMAAGDEDADFTFVVARAALMRLFGWSPEADDGEGYHLTSDLRGIALALLACGHAGDARATYRLAKSIELLCETVQLLAAGALAPLAPQGALALDDTRRLVAARRMIDERWTEPLTLDAIARACGINRAKLTRGFRALYRCSVAEALAERRLAEAGRQLLITDLPVSTIGYRSGYLNNASFARAFGRRYGVSPSDYRARDIAA